MLAIIFIMYIIRVGVAHGVVKYIEYVRHSDGFDEWLVSFFWPLPLSWEILMFLLRQVSKHTIKMIRHLQEFNEKDSSQ